MTDYSKLIDTTLTLDPDMKIITVAGEGLCFTIAPQAVLVSYDSTVALFICDLRTGDEHDGKQFTMSDYAVDLILGSE